MTSVDNFVKAKAEDDAWQGIEESIEDPEEMRVLCCALDSFL